MECPVCGVTASVAYRDTHDFLCGSPGTYTYVQCPTCRLLWITPQPSAAELSRLYEEYYTTEGDLPALQFPEHVSGVRHALRQAILGARHGYAGASGASRLVGHALGLVPALDARAQYGLGLIFPRYRPGGKLLDVGCGHGWIVKIMADWGWDALGVEPNPAVAAKGRELYGIRVQAGSLEEQAFPAGSFDCVIIHHVLEHVTDPQATLREIHRILKPGGKVHIALPNGVSLASRWFGKDWRGACPPWHLYLFSPKSLGSMMASAGFRVAALRTPSAGAGGMYTSSRRIKEGTFKPGEEDPPTAWFQALAGTVNFVTREAGENIEAVGEKDAR
jgi:2-polyprenyl-3-methyl-5-hydroxy-6-metoxy-1,4-benzoquinol methylase